MRLPISGTGTSDGSGMVDGSTSRKAFPAIKPERLAVADQVADLREIKQDIAYFNRSYRRADVSVDITGCRLDDASRRIWDVLKPAPSKDQSDASEQRTAIMHARA
jgi:hypothetical protein